MTNLIAQSVLENSFLNVVQLVPNPSPVRKLTICTDFLRTVFSCWHELILGIGGTRFISFEGRHWHNDCFVCSSCRGSLVGKGFITDADDIICPECAKKKLMADTVEQ